MDISNRALAMFLLAAIVVSLGGTIVSLNKLDSVTTTGYVPAPTGQVNLTVNSSLSITTEDANGIDFGECTTANGVNATINTDDTGNTPTRCASFNANNISVRNDGNVPANVTIQANKVGNTQGGTFLASSSAESELYYKITSEGRGAFSGGCDSIYTGADSYSLFSTAATEYIVCDNLTNNAENNSFVTDFQITLPYDAPVGQETVTITYTAYEI
ncbi:hypothetical protein K9L67_00775 [Candidatus Woesearchaeota archaeon]|nr:hypothetical protein [Candidatus Woesearchaeota archaeon]MCF7900740.1 hypothetical protein [Candidatus Woesearchaeota archaeon]MCF8012905.1 hypothetical protein [Candidatus Woesearchaeota archaeon]